MTRKDKEAWAVRCWHWKPGVDRYADEDVADQQDEQFRRAPTKALAHAAGRKLAAHPLAASTGMYDVLRGIPDEAEDDGYRWTVDEEVRP